MISRFTSRDRQGAVLQQSRLVNWKLLRRASRQEKGRLSISRGRFYNTRQAVAKKRSVMDWKTIDHEYAKDFIQRVEAMTPEPLYESSLLPTPKACLVCGRRRAQSALYAGTRLVVPLCKDCAADWNAYGYDILKKVRPKQLVWRLAKYKAFHPFSRPGLAEIYRDVAAMAQWSKKMKAIMKGMSRQ
jgi:hypothetical protein